MPKLSVDHRDYERQANQLAELAMNLGPLEARYQKLAAEIILIRLFALMEAIFESITTKVLSGAVYVDATAPNVLVPCTSRLDALDKMRKHGRPKALKQLKWTMVAFVKHNVKYVLHSSDHLITTFDIHSSVIEEIRCVRNHAAHRNASTRRAFREVVRRYYGSYVPAVTPGILLLSRRATPVLLEQYILKSKVVVKELVRG